MTVAWNEVLVVLNVPPVIEEAVVDTLLSRQGGGGFTSYPVSGHSSAHAGLSAAEQVAGRQRRHQFEVRMPAAMQGRFLAELDTAFAMADIRYWVLPVLASGPQPSGDHM